MGVSMSPKSVAIGGEIMSELEAKALRQPFRFGLMLGALVVPSGWVLSQDLLGLIIGKPLLHSEEVTQLFAIGCLPGMILGAGLLRAWVAWRAQKTGSARWLLVGHSFFSVLICWVLVPPLFSLHSYLLARPPRDWDSPLATYAFLLYDLFPLQCALVMLLVSLFLRSPRR